MATSPARLEKPSPKRDLLIDTALSLFYREGYRAVGIDTILAKSGVAKMTLYNHFASKEDLIVAAIELQGERLGRSVGEALAGAGGTPKKKLMALLDWYGRWFREEDFNGCAMIRAASEYPEFSSSVHQAVVREKAKGLVRIQNLVTEMGLPDPKDLAMQIHLILEGAIVRAFTFKDPSAAAHAKRAVLALVSG